MKDLLSFHAHICVTAGGFLIHQNKLLLVKHKKLGMWLAPGGHVEAGELPYETAEREVFEETNVKVQVVSSIPLIDSSVSQYLPTPLAVNLHWISEYNYHNRLNPDPLWPRGCEQHLGYIYLVKPLEDIVVKHDPNESDAIGWFSLDQIDDLQTKPDIKQEIELAFKVSQSILN